MNNYLKHNILFLIGGAFLFTTLQHCLIMWLSITLTMIVVTIIGVWKERRDKKFDWWDLIMDEAGGIEGILIAIVLI
jgi:hypothetical protein